MLFRYIKQKVIRLFFFTIMTILIMSLVVGCSGQPLSDDFTEEEVRTAAKDVIYLINDQDADGLLALCTVAMKQALTDEVLAQIFEAIGEGGQFEQVSRMAVGGSTDKTSGEVFAVVVANAKYDLKTFTFTITFTRQMKLAGLYYK